MLLQIKNRFFGLFWTTYKCKKFWQETRIKDDLIPVRLCIELNDGTIHVEPEIYRKPWRILANGIQNGRGKLQDRPDDASKGSIDTPSDASSVVAGLPEHEPAGRENQSGLA